MLTTGGEGDATGNVADGRGRCRSGVNVFLAVGLASIAWSTRRHRRAGPLGATVVGSLAVVLGRIVWSVPSLVYVGAVLLVAASLWNAWLKRPRQEPLVQIGLTRKEGRDEEANDRGIHGGMSPLR